jgi:peptidyl-prolyl cis-trans isomerase D
MLGSIRAKNTNKMVIWAILALLALGLIGFGGIGQGGGTIRSVAQVGDEKIGTDTYAQAMNRALSELSQQMGRTVTATEAQTFGLQNSVLQNLLTTAALDDETAKLGISVGDEAVRAQLISSPAFQGLDGSFDRESYEYTLERVGLSPAEYDKIIRKQASRIFLQAAVASGVKSQGTQSQVLLQFDRETRDFTWAELTDAALDAPIPDPTEAQVKSHYEANPQAYTAPLTRKITYAWLSPDMLADQVDVTEDLVKESYDLQSDRYNKSEKRSIARLVFGTMEEATTARNLLDAGTATFNTLLADRELTPEDVDLGEVERGGISKSAADVVFATQALGVVGPVESSVGPALFNVNAILAADITSFEDARAEITAELAGEAARRLVNDLVPDIDDLLAAGDTLETLAADTDMELGTIDLTRETAEGMAAYETFRDIANQANVGDYPEVRDLTDGGIFALRVDAIVEPALRPLDTVKDLAASDWKQAETVRLLTIKAEALKNDLEAGASFGSLDAHVETNVGRGHFIENTPPALLDEMFSNEPGKASTIAGAQSVFVARLDKISDFDTSIGQNQALKDTVQQQLDTQIGNDLLTIFANIIREETDTSINQAAINQINIQLTGGQPSGYGTAHNNSN